MSTLGTLGGLKFPTFQSWKWTRGLFFQTDCSLPPFSQLTVFQHPSLNFEFHSWKEWVLFPPPPQTVCLPVTWSPGFPLRAKNNNRRRLQEAKRHASRLQLEAPRAVEVSHSEEGLHLPAPHPRLRIRFVESVAWRGFSQGFWKTPRPLWRVPRLWKGGLRKGILPKWRVSLGPQKNKYQQRVPSPQKHYALEGGAFCWEKTWLSLASHPPTWNLTGPPRCFGSSP